MGSRKQRSSLEDKFKLLTAFLKNSLNFSAISRSSEKVLSSLTNVIFSVALFLSLRKGFMFYQNASLSVKCFRSSLNNISSVLFYVVCCKNYSLQRLISAGCFLYFVSNWLLCITVFLRVFII